MESFLIKNALGHLVQPMIDEGVTLDVLLEATDSELCVLCQKIVDKIKLRTALDKLRKSADSSEAIEPAAQKTPDYPSDVSVLDVGSAKSHIDCSPKYYANPDSFNPDNFLQENTQNRHYYSFIPFSAGPRSCVGRKYAMLKLKVLLSTILRNYRSISEIPEEQFQLKGDIILKRTDGFRIKIEPRNRAQS